MQESVKQDRERYIGGSDIGVIMNLSPFKSRFDLLLEKAGYKENDFEGNVYTEYGNALEPKIREYINKGKDTHFIEGKHTREAVGDEIIGVRIHTDGERMIEGEYEILEIKTTSRVYEDVNDYKLYLVQLLFYMVNCNAFKGLLAVYHRPDDLSEEFDSSRLQLFEVNVSDYRELIEDISEAIERFISDLVKVKNDPFITEDELLPVEIPEITKQIIALEESLKYMKETETKLKVEKQRLAKAMEASGVKSWTTPRGYKITYVAGTDPSTTVVKKFDEEAFKSAYAGLYEKFLNNEVITKNGRAGYVKITAPKSDKSA